MLILEFLYYVLLESYLIVTYLLKLVNSLMFVIKMI